MSSKGLAITASPPVRRVRIEEIDFTRQTVMVSMPSVGSLLKIPLSVRSTRAEVPKVGETWLISRHNGSQWALEALIAPGVPTPTVTGSRALSDPVSLSLLAAMVSLGLVEDGTIT